MGPVELDLRLLCQEVSVGIEAVKLGGDQSVHGHLECLVFKSESV